MIVERRSFSSSAQVPLPEPVRSALAAIAHDMRDIPRDCLVDRMELLHWLRRMARRVDGVAAMTVVRPGALPKRVRNQPIRRLTPCEVAEAVFRKRAPHRTIVSRKGRAVRVETRSRCTLQLEMEFRSFRSLGDAIVNEEPYLSSDQPTLKDM